MRARLTLIGLSNYDETLFNALTFPDGIDRETALMAILNRCGEMPLYYTNLITVKDMISMWSKKWREPIARMIKALDAEYNPIHNYDRIEDWNDSGSRSESADKTGTARDTINRTQNTERADSASGSNTDTTEDTVSAFNVDDYQPSKKTSGEGSDSRTSEGSEEVTEDTTQSTATSEKNIVAESNNSTHAGHVYGNIGVMTTMSMIREEIGLRENVNIYDVIAELFCKEFCIPVY